MISLACFLFWTPARRHRHVVCAALCCTAGACTFPDVTYTDGGTPPCTVGSTCTNKAASCGKQAQNTRGACEQMSCGGTSCPMCTMQYEADIAACVSECEACGTLEGCSNATDYCETTVNSA